MIRTLLSVCIFLAVAACGGDDEGQQVSTQSANIW